MIILDYKDRRPIYEQIVEKFETLMLRGILEPDSQLPSVRSLATDLSINPNTIQRAYARLESEGYIYSVKGRGSFVAAVQEMKENKEKELYRQLRQLTIQAFTAGVTKKELVDRVSQYYDEGGQRDDQSGESDKEV